MSDDIIRQIDAAVRANLCACGCGQQIPARGPSPDFINEKHQQAWTARGYRASGGKVAADWYTRLRAPDSVPVPADYDDTPEEECDDPNCGCCHSDWWITPTPDPDETPMARVVRETSSLRRAIDKIRGIRQ